MSVTQINIIVHCQSFDTLNADPLFFNYTLLEYLFSITENQAFTLVMKCGCFCNFTAI